MAWTEEAKAKARITRAATAKRKAKGKLKLRPQLPEGAKLIVINTDRRIDRLIDVLEKFNKIMGE